ncbi:MAG: MFS transporter, partial [Actinomycetes bacterium]
MTVSNGATTTAPQELNSGRRKLATWSWALWDWAEQPYPTIFQTFIFATYIVSSPFGNPDSNAQWLAVAGAIAGLIVAVTSPVIDQATDQSGHRKR